jgi:hypothetical protein
MRQGSAFNQMAPRLSLPQRAVVVPSTQADALENQPAGATKQPALRRTKPVIETKPVLEEVARSAEQPSHQTGKQRTTQALIKLPTLDTVALAGPVEVLNPPSLADLRLIPATSPLPRVGSRHRSFRSGPAPRITYRKLLLFGTVLFAVLIGTLATAGGGPVVNLLVDALRNSVPSNSAMAVAGGDISQRVHPIIQADSNAGYDSQAQHDAWWNSVCSAASFTEVARAWGITNISLGQVVDRLVAHNPPYITISGGLMTQDGWPWMAEAYNLHAVVAWHAYTFDSLIQQVNSTGIPIIIGMKAASWGHFVVVVGGDSTHAEIVDSSLWRMTSLPRSYFTGPTSGIINEPIWWNGETITITPL